MKTNILSFDFPPTPFNPKIEVAGCFCEFENKFLLLKRHPEKPYGSTWSVPAGKIEVGESPEKAVKREVYEETALLIPDPEEVKTIYHRLPEMDYIFHVFFFKFSQIPNVELALEEHVEKQWLSLDAALTLPLIPGGIEAIETLKAHLDKSKHF